MLGIIAVMYVEMSVNTDIFLAFITTMLVPKLRRGMYVIYFTRPQIARPLKNGV